MLWSMHDVNDFHDGGLDPRKPRHVVPSNHQSRVRLVVAFSAASDATASSITIRTATMQVVGHTMKEPAANAKVGKGHQQHQCLPPRGWALSCIWNSMPVQHLCEQLCVIWQQERLAVLASDEPEDARTDG